MAVFNLSISADTDDGHEDEGTTWDDRVAEGYPVGEFFGVLQTNSAGTNRLGALRFPSTGIPQGATITSATLTVNVTVATSIDAVNSVLVVTGDDVDNSAALSSSHRPSSGWTNTTATTNHAGLAVGDEAIDVTAIVQEIVDRAGFGGNIAFKLTLGGSDTYWDINIADYDASTTTTLATLDVVTADAGSTLTADFGTYTITGSAALADYEMNGDQGSYTITGQDAGLRFAKRTTADFGTYTISGQIAALTYSGAASAPDTGTGSSGVFKVRKALVVSTTGRAKWVNYIPVKEVEGSTPGRTDANGAIEVELLGSGTGLTEWVDYIPIVEVVDGDSGKWRYDNSGWIPILFVE